MEELPPGRERSEWLVLKERHPNADLPGWVLKRDWGPPDGCAGHRGPQYSFVRICPDNGAVMLDWMQPPRFQDPFLRGSQGVGPRVLPPELRQPSKLTPAEAWRRVIQAIRSRGAEVPPAYSQPGQPVLRILQAGQRLRLVYQFGPPAGTTRMVSADVLTGEVGGLTLSYVGIHGLDPNDPLRVFSGETWVRTSPPLDVPPKGPLGWEKQIRVEARGVRFRRLLEILYADTGLHYTVSSEVPDSRLTLSLRSVPLRTALRLVTDRMRERVPELVVNTRSDAWIFTLLK